MNADAGRAYEAALEHEQRGETMAAIAQLEEAVRLAPEDAFYLKKLAWREHDRGNHRIALGLFQRALELVPESTNTLDGIGSTLLDLGRNEEALHVFEKCVSREPTANHFIFLGNALNAMNRSAEAEKAFNRALAGGMPSRACGGHVTTSCTCAGVPALMAPKTPFAGGIFTLLHLPRSPRRRGSPCNAEADRGRIMFDTITKGGSLLGSEK